MYTLSNFEPYMVAPASNPSTWKASGGLLCVAA